jgi:hypothetical protein
MGEEGIAGVLSFIGVKVNTYTLYYFVYMYTQICDENALIWGFSKIQDSLFS